MCVCVRKCVFVCVHVCMYFLAYLPSRPRSIETLMNHVALSSWFPNTNPTLKKTVPFGETVDCQARVWEVQILLCHKENAQRMIGICHSATLESLIGQTYDSRSFKRDNNSDRI